MHFYGYSHAEVLGLPLRIFWLLSLSVERIRAEQDLCNLQVASAAQATKEGFQRIWDGLTKRVGKIQEINAKWEEDNAPKDKAGMAELRRMFGAKPNRNAP